MLFRGLAGLALIPSLAAVAPDGAAPAEVGIAPAVAAFVAPVDCALYREVEAWGGAHGYRFPRDGVTCGRRAIVAVSWTEAAVWANAFSERSGFNPSYVDGPGRAARDADRIGPVPVRDLAADGYRLPTLSELGQPALRARMTRLQEWTDTRIDLGDGHPYFYLCRPGACDFHSPRTTGPGVAFRLVRGRAK